MKKNRCTKKPRVFVANVEVQDVKIKSFGFELDKPLLFGPQGLELLRTLYEKKCSDIFTSRIDEINEYKKGLKEDLRDAVLAILCIKDQVGKNLASRLVPKETIERCDYEGINYIDVVVEKKWLLSSLLLDIKLRDKLREADGLGVIVIDFGLIEVFVA